MNAATLAALRAARAEGRAVALLTWLVEGEQRLAPFADAPPGLADAIATALRTDQAAVVTVDGAEVFVEPHNPPLRLILVGAVHIAAPLAEMATLTGFAVTIVDPRRAFATAARFPGRTLVVAWPDVAIGDLALDARAAVVTLTHDPKLDDPALHAALATPAFYVGCLGSTRTHAARRERLTAAGVGAGALARLRGPVGLRIGARTPAELAVSVLAEIIATLRGGSDDGARAPRGAP